MAKYSQWPRGVLKAVFHFSPSRILTNSETQLRRLSLVKIVAPRIGSKAGEMRGILIFNGELVKTLVVNARSQALFFLHIEESSSHR